MSITVTPPVREAGDPSLDGPPSDGIPSAANRTITRGPDISARASGLGALGFVGLVIVQNLIRGGAAPTPGDGTDEVLAHYAEHRTLTVVLLATFVLGLCSLAVFLGGTVRRLLRSERPGWAILGCVSACSVIALFAGVVAAEQALSVLAASSHPDLGAVEAIWALHNSVFTVNLLFIAMALVGLSRAGIAAGITPKIFGRLAPVGAVLLASGTITGPLTANGEAMALFAVSVLGFVVWLAFLVTTGVRLVRSDAA
jgi:hypothetical protein